MSLAIVYMIIMWVWVFGAYMWIFTALNRDEPKLLIIAGLYGAIGIFNGVVSLIYQAQGK